MFPKPSLNLINFLPRIHLAFSIGHAAGVLKAPTSTLLNLSTALTVQGSSWTIGHPYLKWNEFLSSSLHPTLFFKCFKFLLNYHILTVKNTVSLWLFTDVYNVPSIQSHYSLSLSPFLVVFFTQTVPSVPMALPVLDSACESRHAVFSFLSVAYFV